MVNEPHRAIQPRPLTAKFKSHGLGSSGPQRRAEIVDLGFRTLIAGMLATLMTAAVVGWSHPKQMLPTIADGRPSLAGRRQLLADF